MGACSTCDLHLGGCEGWVPGLLPSLRLLPHDVITFLC